LPRLCQAVPPEAGCIIAHPKTTASSTSSRQTRASLNSCPSTCAVPGLMESRKEKGCALRSHPVNSAEAEVCKSVRSTEARPSPVTTISHGWAARPPPRRRSRARELWLAEWKKVSDPFSNALCSLITNCKLCAYTLTVWLRSKINVKTSNVCFILLSGSATRSVLTMLSPNPIYDTEHLLALL